MKTMWITQAIAAGGTMAVSGPIIRNRICRAKMEWPGEDTIFGEASTSIEGAIENLNEALMHHAAKEMQENGSV